MMNVITLGLLTIYEACTCTLFLVIMLDNCLYMHPSSYCLPTLINHMLLPPCRIRVLFMIVEIEHLQNLR